MKKQYSDENIIILESALYRTTTTIIIGENYIVLIDPNWLPNEIDYIKKELEKHEAGKDKYLIFTHSDYDHIIGWGKFKEYKTIASKNFVTNPNKEKIIEEIKTFDDEYYIERDYDIQYPTIDIEIEEAQQVLNIGKDTYVFYQMAGHTNDSLAIYNQTKGLLIAGDYLSNIEFPFIYHNSKTYQKTLEIFTKIINLNDIKLLVVGHGDYTKSKVEMNNRIAISKSYIEELKASILTETDYDIDYFLKQYKYPKGLKKSHFENVKLMKKELN